MSDPHFTGARLVPGERWLEPQRVENLARFEFFRQRLSELPAANRLLDLGCGAGEGTVFLAGQAGWQVSGVDLDTAALAFAHRTYADSPARFSAQNAERLAFPADCFDAVISVEVIEHIPDPRAYLQEAWRVLRPGGLFVLTTPNKLRSSPTPGSLWPEHLREYTPEQFSSLVRAVFPNFELWGEHVPVYEAHPLRRLVRRLAPFIKPILPRAWRVRALPAVQSAIRADLRLEDVVFTQTGIPNLPTLVGICHK